MFDIEFKEEALDALRRIKPFHARQILNAVEKHLRFEPERTSRTRIKRLRGPQQAVFRLRVGDYRVFYDVEGSLVTVVAILRKDETRGFHKEGGEA
jgi:mRNA-degrading endonuclease RelE of RelBE toxin-antitoxin system